MSGVALAHAEILGELRARLGGRLDAGLETRRIERIVSARASETRETDLIVVTHQRFVDHARRASGVFLCTPELALGLEPGRRFEHRHAMWVVAELLAPIEQQRTTPHVQKAAYVERGAEIAAGVAIAPGAVILSGARLKDGVTIGPNAVIYGDVSLGSGCTVAANAVLYQGVVAGERVAVGAGSIIGRPGFGFTESPDGRRVRVPQLGGVVIEDDVEIGALCTIDAGTLGPTRLRVGCKLDAHVHVGHNAELGQGSIVAAQTGFAGSVTIGSGVLIGGQSGFADHVVVGNGARIAGKSGVIGDVPEGAVVAGFPAVARIKWLRAMAALLRVDRSRGSR